MELRREVKYSLMDLTEEQAVALTVILGRQRGRLSNVTHELYEKLHYAMEENGWDFMRRCDEYPEAFKK